MRFVCPLILEGPADLSMACLDLGFNAYVLHCLERDTLQFFEAVKAAAKPDGAPTNLWRRGQRDLMLHLLELLQQIERQSKSLSELLEILNYLAHGGVDEAIRRCCLRLSERGNSAAAPAAAAE